MKAGKFYRPFLFLHALLLSILSKTPALFIAIKKILIKNK